MDLCQNVPSSTDLSTIYISAGKGTGIDKLREYIRLAASGSTERVKDVLINQRQASLLRQTASDLRNALDALNNGLENELVSIDIKSAAMHLGEITGQTWSEDVINNIFSRFCIGK
jgi:tRNA modification GTPase